MISDTQVQPNSPMTRRDPDVGETCADCGGEVMEASADTGLNCARCGQWQALCDGCMPNVTDFARDAVWSCPECRERPLDA